MKYGAELPKKNRTAKSLDQRTSARLQEHASRKSPWASAVRQGLFYSLCRSDTDGKRSCWVRDRKLRNLVFTKSCLLECGQKLGEQSIDVSYLAAPLFADRIPTGIMR